MRASIVFFTVIASVGVVAAASAKRVPVPTDQKAIYEALELAVSPSGTAIITTRRTGPSGTSFSIRECDCMGVSYRYLGDGASLADAQSQARNEPFTDLTQGSVSAYVCNFACNGR